MTEFVIKLADERGRVMEQSHAAAPAGGRGARLYQAGDYVDSLKAACPILGSLERRPRRQKLPHFRVQLEDVAARVKTGESISQAFEAQGGFPIVYTKTLLAGEGAGDLEEVLQRFLDFQRVSLTFRKKLKASLIYPALLVVMVIGLFIFLITFVVPRFAQLYEQMGTKLPALTLFLLGLGKQAQSYGLYLAGALAVLIFLFFRWTRTD